VTQVNLASVPDHAWRHACGVAWCRRGLCGVNHSWSSLADSCGCVHRVRNRGHARCKVLVVIFMESCPCKLPVVTQLRTRTWTHSSFHYATNNSIVILVGNITIIWYTDLTRISISSSWSENFQPNNALCKRLDIKSYCLISASKWLFIYRSKPMNLTINNNECNSDEIKSRYSTVLMNLTIYSSVTCHRQIYGVTFISDKSPTNIPERGSDTWAHIFIS
jgi:hypothetical protein